MSDSKDSVSDTEFSASLMTFAVFSYVNSVGLPVVHPLGPYRSIDRATDALADYLMRERFATCRCVDCERLPLLSPLHPHALQLAEALKKALRERKSGLRRACQEVMELPVGKWNCEVWQYPVQWSPAVCH